MHPHHAAAQNPGKTAEAQLSAAVYLAQELGNLREEFSDFHIWQEASGDRIHYVARRRHTRAHPHTIVTADPYELRPALEDGRQAAASQG
jgi:hypothetical protein